MRVTILALIALVFSFSCRQQGDQSKLSKQQKVSRLLDSLVVVNDIPGINLSILEKDNELLAFSAGYADLSQKFPMDSGLVMFSGSIGKTYAAAVLFQLIDEGKVGLDDKFLRYFPKNDWLKNVPNIEDITIRMLLEHTSGLPRYVMKPEIWDTIAATPQKIWSYRNRLEFIFGDEAVHQAGKGFHYSDTNYILIGMLIEKVTGSYYYNEVEQRILKPMSLSHTYDADSNNIPNLPQGYSRLPEMFNVPEIVVDKGSYIFNPQLEWTGGGFASTTPDLVRWAGIYYRKGLFSDSLKAMVVTPNPNGKELYDDPDLDYGMGSFIYRTRHGEAYGHTGFVPGFNSIFTYFPEQDIAVAIQSNCDYAQERMSLIEYVEEVLDIYLEKDIRQSDQQYKMLSDSQSMPPRQLLDEWYSKEFAHLKRLQSFSDGRPDRNHFGSEPFNGWACQTDEMNSHKYSYCLFESGQLIRQIGYYANRQLDHDFSLKNGKSIGYERMWRKNGDPYIEFQYSEPGIKQGLHNRWYANRKLSMISMYHQGELVYELQFDKAGKVTSSKNKLPSECNFHDNIA